MINKNCYSPHVWDSRQEGYRIPCGPHTYVCSHLCHLNTVMLLGGQVSVPTAGPQSWDFTHIHTEKRGGGGRKNEGDSTPQCVIYTSVQTGCGRIEGVPWGRLSSAPLSLPSCPHPLCRRRNRRLSGPVQGRRSASYITTLLSWGWEAELARALIIAVGLRWPPLGTAGGSLG